MQRVRRRKGDFRTSKVIARVDGRNYVLRDGKGELLECGVGGNSKSALIRALKGAADFTSGELYIFTDSGIAKQYLGKSQSGVQMRKRKAELELLAGFFKRVEFLNPREVTRNE
jgi:hypothetical protein